MKLAVPLLSVAFAQQQPLPSNLPPGFSPQTPTNAPITTTTQAPFNGKRCPTMEFNFETPQETADSVCPEYSCSSCCNADFASKAKVDPLVTKKYGPYDFTGCQKNGQLGSSCHEFIRKSRCVKQCDPNSFAHYPDQQQLAGAQSIPVCDSFCTDFFNACKNEKICYSNKAMKSVLMALIDGDSEAVEGKVFTCDGAEGIDYTCEKLGDTFLAGEGGLYDNGSDNILIKSIKEKIKEYENTVGTLKEPHQKFCERFSAKLYSPVDNIKDTCVDPRQPSTVADYAREQPTYSNYVTEPCSTGLSTGAIIGIVIGSLAGVAIIAVVVYFLACNGSDDGEKEDGKGSYAAGGYTSTNTAEPANIVKSGSDYDPDAERKASNTGTDS